MEFVNKEIDNKYGDLMADIWDLEEQLRDKEAEVNELVANNEQA